MTGKDLKVRKRIVGARSKVIFAALMASTALVNFGAGPAVAADVTWEGTVSADWLTGGNWDTGTAPNTSDDVHIDDIGVNTPRIDGIAIDTGTARIGEFGAGALEILNAGSLDINGSALIGENTGSIGTVTVSGANSELITGLSVAVGYEGSGYLTISDQGLVSADTVSVGLNTTGSFGVVTVTDTGSTLEYDFELNVGGEGTGELSVLNGASVVSTSPNGDAFLGLDGTGTGTLYIRDSGSHLISRDLYVGQDGTGNVLVEQEGELYTNGTAYLGYNNGNGTATISGAGSLWNVGSSLRVGESSTGELNVEDGGYVGVADTTYIAANTGSSGEVTVTGGGSQLETFNVLYVGNGGDGTLTIADGGVVDAHATGNAIGVFGGINGGDGLVTVTGSGSRLNNDGDLRVGFSGNGVLTLADGGVAAVGGSFILADTVGSTGTLNIGAAPGDPAQAAGFLSTNGIIGITFGGGTGVINFNHTNSSYTFTKSLAGVGTVNQLAGTTVLFVASPGFTDSEINIFGGTLSVEADDYLGDNTTSVTLDGGALRITGTTFTSTARTITLGSNGGEFDISSSANQFTLGQGLAGSGSLTKSGFGTLVLTGANTFFGGTTIDRGTLELRNGSALTDLGAVTVNAAGTLEITDSETIGETGVNGGTITIAAGEVLTTTGFTLTNGSVQGGTLSGSSYTLLNGTLNTAIGNGNAVNVTGGGLVSLGLNASLNSVGALTIDSASTLDLGATSQTTGAFTLTDGTVFQGTLTSSSYSVENGTVAAELAGAGALTKIGSGTVTLTETNTYTGGTTISAGTLIVNGSVDGDVQVDGGVLGGSGTLGGTVTVTNAVLAPGESPGTLTIVGDLVLTSGSILDFELGSPSGTAGVDSDLIEVGANLTLDGTLDVTDAGGFGAGLYRLINYGGTLTDNGLDVGGTPAGFLASDLTVDTATAGEVNLLVAAMPLTFWDGPNTTDNGTIDGGTGTWDATTTNWTSNTGTPNSRFDPASLLIFSGTAGTVTVDNGAGAVSTSGMQFAVDGYTVAGDDLTLSGSAVARVGDGTSAGSGFSTTISSNLIGTGSLEKTDLGTLILTGANSYTGGTTISAGMLVGDTTSLQGDIANNAALVFDQGTAGTYADVISGTGSLTIEGSGTLTLTGTNSYTGGTLIAGGTLDISDDDNLGDAAGGLTFDGGTLQTASVFGMSHDIVLENGGGTFNIAGSVRHNGTISGAGGLTKSGIGSLSLGGANSYTGGTMVEAGVLLGSAGSIRGDIAIDSAGVVVFDQDVDATYSNSLSGSGIFGKAGANALTMSGDSSSFAGQTIVDEGDMRLTGLLGGDLGIEPDGTFRFDQTFDADFDGVISGTGFMAQEGTGRLTLNGDSSGFGGATTIDSGTLLVNGMLGGTLDVLDGGILGGSGTVGITAVASGGTLAPGNSIGTLHTSGDLTFGAGSFYLVEVAANGDGDNVEVGGQTHIDPTSQVQVFALDPHTSYADGQDYTIIDSTDVVNGQFSGASMLNQSAFITPTLTYPNANEVWLTLAITQDFTAVGGTFNQVQAATGLNDLDQSGDALVVFNEVAMLNADEARRAFDLSSGEVHASGQHVIDQTFALFSRTLRQQGAAGLGGSNITDGQIYTAPLGYGPSAAQPGAAAIDDATTSAYADARVAQAWLAPLGGRGTIDGDGNAGELDWWTAGLAGGYEGSIDAASGRAYAGFGLGYLRSHGAVDARLLTMDADNFNIGIYGGWSDGPWMLTGSLAYAASRVETERRVLFGGIDRTAEADYWNHTIGFSGEAAYGFDLANGTTISPLFTLDAGWSGHGGFTETGASALNLTGASESWTRLDTGLGVALQHVILTDSGKVTLDGRLVWEHAIADVVPSQNLAFAGSPTGFTVNGPDAGRDRVRLGLGVAFEATEDLTIRAGYNGMFSGNQQTHDATLGLNVKF